MSARARDPSALRQRTRRRDDVLFARDHQERRTRQWRVGVDTHHPPERSRPVAALDHGGDHALAHARAVAALVDDQDPLRVLCLFADEGFASIARAARRLIGTPLP